MPCLRVNCSRNRFAQPYDGASLLYRAGRGNRLRWLVTRRRLPAECRPDRVGRHHLRDGETAPDAVSPAIQGAVVWEKGGVSGYSGRLPVLEARACGAVGEAGGGYLN